jgi:glycine/D-amino acid oxidase-like deaminating enzyme
MRQALDTLSSHVLDSGSMNATKSLAREAEVVVVGGGLSGASIAYHLALRGRAVVLVERGELASGASGASTGWATVHFASYMAEYPEGHMRLMAQGLELFLELAGSLGEEVELDRSGGLSLIYSDEELVAQERLAGRLNAAGIPVEVLSREDVIGLEPQLGGEFVAGLYSPGEALVTAPLLVDALARRAVERGAELLTGTEVVGIDLQDGVVAGVETTAGRIRAPAVVNAAGLDAVRVAALAGVDLPLYPSRGQQLLLAGPPGLLSRAVYNPGLVRPTRAGYLVGGLREQATERNEMTLSGVARLAEQAVGMLPALAEARVIGTLPGIRPVPADGMPIYGPVRGVRGFYLASLHFGLTLVALTGRVLASYVLGEEPEVDVSSYRYERFAPDVARLPSGWAQPGAGSPRG